MIKVSVKKIKTPASKEWLILVDDRTIGVAFTKKDAKFIMKCIKKHRK